MTTRVSKNVITDDLKNMIIGISKGEWTPSTDVQIGGIYSYQGSEWRSLTGADVEPVDGLDWRSLNDHTNLANRYEAGAHPASAISTQDGRTVQERLDDLPEEVDAAGTAADLIAHHNSEPNAHPALSSFITAEANRAETAAEVAAATGRIYETSVDGQADAGLVNGDYFWVVSTSDASVLELWRKGVSVSTFTGKTIFTAKSVFEKIEAPELVLFGNNSTMNGLNSFVASVGSPTFDVNGTVAGEMFVDFSTPSTNYAIGITGALEESTSYWCEVDITVISGDAGRLQFGRYSSTPRTSNTMIVIPGSVKKTYKGLFSTAIGVTGFNFGVVAADNPSGFTFSLDNLRVYKLNDEKTIEYIKQSHVFESQTKFDFVGGADSDMSLTNGWRGFIGSPVFDVNTTEAGKLFFDLSGAQAATNKAIGLYGNLSAGQRYKVSVDAKLLSGNSARLRLGGYSSSSTIPADSFAFTPTDTEETYIGYIVPTTDNFVVYLGVAAADNPVGGTYSFDNVLVQAISDKEYEQDLILAQVERLIGLGKEIIAVTETLDMTNKLVGADSDMSGANNWVSAIGSPVFDINNAVLGKMHFDVSGVQAGANKAIKVAADLEIGKQYEIRIKARLASGTACEWRLGKYSSGPMDDAVLGFTPTATESEYTKIITSAVSGDLFLGVLGVSNPVGGTYEFDDVAVIPVNAKDAQQDLRIKNLETVGVVSKANSFFTEQFLQSLSRHDKPLTKICVAGDSLMANYYGGAIPDDEGAGRRPIRLDINSIPRRIYDFLSWNKAQHRRLDDGDWSKVGSWTTVNDNTVWEPQHPTTLYHTSVDPDAYVEITIPAGQENFALIFQKRPNQGVVDVTLNSGSIAAYGADEIDLARANTGSGDNGNPYFTVEYAGLPVGNNTIRISKRSDNNEVRIWGGFYWTGNTMMVYNVAHGGHTMSALTNQGHLQAEVAENDFDAILFELTVMNEMSAGRTIQQSKDDLQFIIDTYFAGKDYCLMTPFPFGDNGAGTNYYPLYLDPSMEDTCNGLRETAYANSSPFINVFDIWKKKIGNRGGTLLGGETGLWYTTDGQHPNESGAREWFNVIRFAMADKPISYD